MAEQLKIPTWEYQFLARLSESDLNKLGRMGWEAIAMSCNSLDQNRVLLKRQRGWNYRQEAL